MKGRLIAVTALLAVSVASGADNWTSRLPEGWLGAVVVRDLEAFDAQVKRLAEPAGRKPPSLRALIDLACPAATFADRPWVVALVANEAGKPAPLVLVPTVDFAEFCETLDADLAEDVAIAEIGGFEVALSDVDGWTAVTLIDTLSEMQLTRTPPPTSDADLLLVASPQGLRHASDALTARRQAGGFNVVRQKQLLKSWPTNLRSALDALAIASPVFTAMADRERPISVELSADDDNFHLALNWAITIPASRQAAQRLQGDHPTIARFEAAGAPAPALVQVGLAVMQSVSASMVEATSFSQPQWDDFAAAVRQFLSSVDSISCLLVDPQEEAPLAANQAIAFGWGGSRESLGDALQLGVIRWNLLMASTRARAPMPAKLAPSPNGEGWIITVDVLGARGRDLLPEEQEILRQFYGDPNGARFTITPQSESRWLASLGPTPPIAAPANKPRGSLIEGELDLGRWRSWEKRLEAFGAEPVGGQQLPAPSSPAQLTIWGGDSIRIEAVLPRTAYEQVVGE